MLKNTKIYGTIIGIILFIILIAGLAYAYISWQSSNINISVGSECFTIDYTKGQNISNSGLYVINEEDFLSDDTITIVDGMALTTIGLGINPSCNISGTGVINLNTSTLSTAFISGNSVGALKYKMVEYSSSTYPDVTVDNLKDQTFTVVAEGEITALGSSEIHTMQLSNDSVNEYIIIFYLDEVLAQNDVAGASFYGTISATVTQNTQ